MDCPKCEKGAMRAYHSSTSKGQLVFCDNVKCFTFFTTKDVEVRSDIVIIYRPLFENHRMTEFMRHHPIVISEQWLEFLNEHQLVEEVTS